MIEFPRRSFLRGMVSALLATPAIVSAASLMPVHSLERFVLAPGISQEEILALLSRRIDEAHALMKTQIQDALYGRADASGAFSFPELSISGKPADWHHQEITLQIAKLPPSAHRRPIMPVNPVSRATRTFEETFAALNLPNPY